MSTTTRGPCPVCNRGLRDTALAVTVDERGTVEYCHRCLTTSYTSFAASTIRSSAGITIRSGTIPAAKSYRPWRDLAARLWERSEPLEGSLAAIYLQSRHCCLPPADGDLRFLAANGGRSPAMVARITDAITGEPISLHFTRLAADGHGKAGTDRDKHFLAGHRKAGGVIRLWPDESVTAGLSIAEGIETCLAAAHLFTPIWAAIDASNMASSPVLAGVGALTIFADHDDAGTRSASILAQRWADAGREVYVTTPNQTGADIADLVAA